MKKNKTIGNSDSHSTVLNWPVVAAATTTAGIDWSRRAMATWAVQIIAEIRHDNAEFCTEYYKICRKDNGNRLRSANSQSIYDWSYELLCLLVDYTKSKRDGEEFSPIKYVDENQKSVLRYFGRINNGLWRVIHLIMEDYPECVIDTHVLEFSIEEIVRSFEIDDNTGRELASRIVGLKNRIFATLFDLSAEYPEAMYLLGLMKEPSDSWILKAADSKFLLATYRRMLEERDAKNAKDALKTVKRLRKIIDGINEKNNVDDIDGVTLNILKESATETLIEFLDEQISSAEESAKKERKALLDAADAQTESAVSQERLLILSALSHTLGNSQSTSRSTVQSAVRILSARSSEMSTLERGALDELTTLYATFNLTDTLIKTFKLLVSDPQTLSAKLREEDEEIDLPSIGAVLAQCLRGTLVSVLFGESYVSQCYNFIGERSAQKLLKMRESFRSELLATHRDDDAHTLLNWISGHLPGLHISLKDQAFRMYLHNKTEHALVYAVISEVIQNAFNHGDTQQQIRINVECEDSVATLEVSNGVTRIKDKNSVRIGRGGLLFIEKLVENLCVPNFLAANFEWYIDSGKFQTNLSLNNLKVN